MATIDRLRSIVVLTTIVLTRSHLVVTHPFLMNPKKKQEGAFMRSDPLQLQLWQPWSYDFRSETS